VGVETSLRREGGREGGREGFIRHYSGSEEKRERERERDRERERKGGRERELSRVFLFRVVEIFCCGRGRGRNGCRAGD
jgi:hypothetical protein